MNTAKKAIEAAIQDNEVIALSASIKKRSSIASKNLKKRTYNMRINISAAN